jgi:hypothetical protein
MIPKLAHLLAITVIALLLGAGLAFLGFATTYEEGSSRWEDLMQLGGAFTSAALIVGLAWTLWQSVTRPRRS